MFGFGPFSRRAWAMRLALLGSAAAVIVGVPIWLEAPLLVFLAGTLIWILRTQRTQRAN